MNAGTQDVTVAISAAGTTQATATLLFGGINWITTAASGSGVVLFPGNPGTSQTVFNGGANSVKIYPTSGAQINGLGTNNAMLLAPNTVCHFWNLSSVQTIGVLSA